MPRSLPHAFADPHRLLRLGPARVDHVPALRIAVGAAGPLLVLLLIGRPEWALFGSFGAFTGIYSRYEPTRLRWRRQTFVGAMLTACVTIGALVAHVGTVAPLPMAEGLRIVVPVLVGLSIVVVSALRERRARVR